MRVGPNLCIIHSISASFNLCVIHLVTAFCEAHAAFCDGQSELMRAIEACDYIILVSFQEESIKTGLYELFEIL